MCGIPRSAKKIEKKLQHYAYYDQLTGLANRTYFNKKLDESFERAKRYKTPFSIMFLDLNKFKDVNDQYGHKYGDQVLVQSAKRIKKLLRTTDLAARLGGDEFLILLDSLEHKNDCQLVAQRIIETIRKPYSVYSKRLHIGVSIGITTYNQNIQNADTLIKQADQAMYKAKLNAKSHYAFFSPRGTLAKKTNKPAKTKS